MTDSSPRRREDSEVITKINFDNLSKQVVDAAFKIHQTVGTGLLEGIYEECFAIELRKRSIPFERQKELPVFYEGERLTKKCILDLVIDNSIVVELKSVEKIIPAHEAQILTYMKTGSFKTGLIINFGEPYFKKAIKRFVLTL